MFLGVASEMTVIVKNDDLTGENVDKDWCMGRLINCNGAVRAPSMYTSFRIQMLTQA